MSGGAMHSWRWLLAGAMVVPLVTANAPSAILAQESDAPAAATSPDAEAAAQTAEDALLDDAALDELVAPVALYPDALLAQIFVAATYPLDVMKAERFIEKNADLSDKERNAKAAEEDWDPSIAALAGGFPTVIQRMADEIDWTEELGDAMLAQTDDVLDAVQRQRSRAVATGYLTSNEAQVVDTTGDAIAIEPADPDVVYVPSYDAEAAYTTAPTAAPVVTQPGMSTSNVLATGAIAFGSAMLLGEIFDDDDDYNNDYWRGPSHIDWDDDAFYPNRGRGGINANGDVNIDVDRNKVKIGHVDRSKIDRNNSWKPTKDQQAQARDRMAARDRANDRGGAAQAKLKERSPADSGGRQKLQAASDKRQAAGKPAVGNLQAAGKPKAGHSALKPGSGGSAKAKAAAARGSGSIDKSKLASAKKPAAKPAISKPKAISRPSKASMPKAHSAPKTSAFKKSSSGQRTKAASSRGHRSSGGGGGHGKRR